MYSYIFCECLFYTHSLVSVNVFLYAFLKFESHMSCMGEDSLVPSHTNYVEKRLVTF